MFMPCSSTPLYNKVFFFLALWYWHSKGCYLQSCMFCLYGNAPLSKWCTACCCFVVFAGFLSRQRTCSCLSHLWQFNLHLPSYLLDLGIWKAFWYETLRFAFKKAHVKAHMRSYLWGGGCSICTPCVSSLNRCGCKSQCTGFFCVCSYMATEAKSHLACRYLSVQRTSGS